MEIRRGLMIGKANGVVIIKGTFTVENTNLVTINFGKNIERYVLLIEMTDGSLENFANAGITINRAYTLLTMRGVKSIGDLSVGHNALTTRYNGSSINFSNASSFNALNTDSFSIYPSNLSTGSANTLYVGYSYNYYVIPID